MAENEDSLSLSLINNFDVNNASNHQETHKVKKSYLYTYLKVPVTILNILGFGDPFKNRHILLRILYVMLSVIFVLVPGFGFVRCITYLEWKGSLDMRFAYLIIFMIWCAQCVFSILHFIYHSRSGHVTKFGQLWRECNVDELISYSPLEKRRFHWFVPTSAVAATYVLTNMVLFVLQYYGVLQKTWDNAYAFHPTLSACVIFLSGSIVGTCWILPQICYFIVCIVFRYAWIGLCEKIEGFDEKDDYGRLCRFVTIRHHRLCMIMSAMNKLFGAYVLFQLSTSIPIILLELYLVASLNMGPAITFKFVMWLAGNTTQVLLISSAALIEMSATGVSEALYNRYVRHYKKYAKSENEELTNVPHLLETLILLEKLHNTKVSMSALGCFEVTRSFLMTLWSALLTYYMVLVQFTQPHIVNGSAKGRNTTNIDWTDLFINATKYGG